MKKITGTIQDYLKAIFQLREEGGSASTTLLADRLGITPASVTGTLQRMAATDPPLIHYRKYRGVTLTSAGERAALEVIRRHRLLETYLVAKLGYSWDEVHDEACRLEHVISEALEARIDETLGHPVRDPHGDPIPSPNLDMPPQRSLPLSQFSPPQRAIVKRIGTDEPAFLRHIEGIGLSPNARIEIQAYSDVDQTLQLCIDGDRKPIVIGPAITDQIHVEEIE